MGFSKEAIQRTWEKGRIIGGNDPEVWRQDECRAWIGRKYYGNRNSNYGWEIDHIKPESEGGTDALPNLRPLQWENKASKQDGYLVCVVIGAGKKNIHKY